jgi:hypothetical protein
MAVGLGVGILLIVPYFAAITSGNLLFITLTLWLSFGSICSYFAVLASFLAYAFPPQIRYSGISLSYQLCSSLIGGPTAFIAQWVLNASGNNPWAVAVFYAALLIATLTGCVLLGRVIARRDTASAPSAEVASTYPTTA